MFSLSFGCTLTLVQTLIIASDFSSVCLLSLKRLIQERFTCCQVQLCSIYCVHYCLSSQSFSCSYSYTGGANTVLSCGRVTCWFSGVFSTGHKGVCSCCFLICLRSAAAAVWMFCVWERTAWRASLQSSRRLRSCTCSTCLETGLSEQSHLIRGFVLGLDVDRRHHANHQTHQWVPLTRTCLHHCAVIHLYEAQILLQHSLKGKRRDPGSIHLWDAVDYDRKFLP